MKHNTGFFKFFKKNTSEKYRDFKYEQKMRSVEQWLSNNMQNITEEMLLNKYKEFVVIHKALNEEQALKLYNLKRVNVYKIDTGEIHCSSMLLLPN